MTRVAVYHAPGNPGLRVQFWLRPGATPRDPRRIGNADWPLMGVFEQDELEITDDTARPAREET